MEGHYHYLIQSSLARDACWTAGCQSTAPAFGRLQNSVVPLAGEEQTLPCACSSSETRFCSSFIPSPDLNPKLTKTARIPECVSMIQLCTHTPHPPIQGLPSMRWQNSW